MLKTLLFLLLTIYLKHICEARGSRVKRIVGGEPAEVPPEDDPVVYTRFNDKTARVQGARDYPHYVFRGIRYAKEPVGSLRFIRPKEYFLEGDVNATVFPPPCLQPVPGQNRIVGQEDCLFLNIYTPTLPTGTEGLPVVLWIHGGGFRYGSASQYGMKALANKQLVVVTIQYRLGSLGFLSTGSREMPGNAALWDMALAVQWTRNYIGFFGGNPYKIVVMGQGNGASSALTVALSNIAKGKASAVIAMSGTQVSHWAMDQTPANSAKEIAEINGCPTVSTVTMIKCLQSVDATSIIKGDSIVEYQRLQQRGFESGLSGGLGTAPVYEGYHDGRSLPPLYEKMPLDDQEDAPKLPLLIGTTKDETKKACHGIFKGEITKKLKSIPDFLNKVMVEKLQGFLPFHHQNQGNDSKAQQQKSFLGLGEALNPNNFKNYLQVKKNDILAGLHKISEVTADALFNVPAFLTADFWAKKGSPVYMYRFEHAGKLRKGFDFLRGLPMVGNDTQQYNDADLNDTVSHGDELSYIFDPHDIHGNPLPAAKSDEDDEKVREFFTQMIADFARRGKILLNNEEARPFSSQTNNYVEVAKTPKQSTNFRFCQMALWLDLSQRLQSATCSFLNVVNGIGADVISKLPTLPTLPPLPILGRKPTPPKRESSDQKINNNMGIFTRPFDVFQSPARTENKVLGGILGG